MRDATVNGFLADVARWIERGGARVASLPLDCIRDQYQRARAAAGLGGHWFEPSTMRFFRSRLAESAYVGAGGVFFVSSEKPPHGDRAYSVRRFCPLTGDISTVGDFCGIAHRSTADRRARRYAERGADA